MNNPFFPVKKMSNVAGDTSAGGDNNVDGNTNDHANQTPGHNVSVRRTEVVEIQDRTLQHVSRETSRDWPHRSKKVIHSLYFRKKCMITS